MFYGCDYNECLNQFHAKFSYCHNLKYYLKRMKLSEQDTGVKNIAFKTGYNYYRNSFLGQDFF